MSTAKHESHPEPTFPIVKVQNSEESSPAQVDRASTAKELVSYEKIEEINKNKTVVVKSEIVQFQDYILKIQSTYNDKRYENTHAEHIQSSNIQIKREEENDRNYIQNNRKQVLVNCGQLTQPIVYVPANAKPKKQEKIEPKVFTPALEKYLNRRKNNLKYPKDLAVCELWEVLEQAKLKKLISSEIFNQYRILNGTKQLKKFLKCVQTEKIHTFDFTSTKFTLIDHRRLSELLIYLFPQEYFKGQIDVFHICVRDFLRLVYSLPENEYVHIYQAQDNISRVSLWAEVKDLLPNNKGYFQSKQSLWSSFNLLSRLKTGEDISAFIKENFALFKLRDREFNLDKLLTMRVGKVVQNSKIRQSDSEQQESLDRQAKKKSIRKINKADHKSKTKRPHQKPKASPPKLEVKTRTRKTDKTIVSSELQQQILGLPSLETNK